MNRLIRKKKEKEARRALILDTAKDLLRTDGIEALTMRKLADRIAYSPCILYETFPNKEALIIALFSIVCQELLIAMQKTPPYKSSVDHFKKLVWSDIHFMMQESYRIELFMIVSTTLVPKDFPPAMQQVVNLFEQGLLQLNYPKLTTKRKRKEALDVLRTFLTGVLKLSLVQKSRCKKILFNGVDTLLNGWQ